MAATVSRSFRKLTPRERDFIRQEYPDCCSVRSLARVMGLTVHQVYRHARSLGVTRKHDTPGFREELYRMYNLGHTDLDIAEELRCSPTTVREVRRRMGLKALRGRGRPAATSPPPPLPA